MTRTQLTEMTDRDLIEHARRQRESASWNGNPAPDTLFALVEELANRLDDVYPFNPEPETTGDLQEA